MRRLVVFVWLASCVPALAAEKVAYGPPAAWVTTDPIKPIPTQTTADDDDAGVVAPLKFLQTDSQSRFTAADVSDYVAFRVKVNTAQGLPIGGFSREWDPATDVLTIHRLRIERDGKVIDVLRNQKFEILRRERSLEQSMLDGRLTATLQIADLRVGDIVDFASTQTRAQPVLAGRNGGVAYFSPLTRVDEARVRMLWDRGAPLRWTAGAALPAPVVTETASGGELLLQVADFKGPMPPESAPVRYSFGGTLQASQAASWKDVSATFLPLYTRAAQLERGSPLKAEADRIRQAAKTPAERASLALKLVEDQIRYVAIQMNAQGYTPAAADETWRRRFGDCKAKTALLMALLQELEIEAAPALVNTRAGESLPSLLPRADAFDHVIVRARIDGKDYWLDGTRSGDGPIESQITPWFSWALPLTTEGSDLVRLRPGRFERPTLQYTLRMDMSAGFEKDAPVELEIIDRDIDSGAIAHSMQALPKAQVQRRLISSYEDTYDGLRFTEADWRYDERQSRIVYTFKGVAVPRVTVASGRKRFEIPGGAIYNPELRLRPTEQDQTAAYKVDDSDYVRRLTIITLPKDEQQYAVYGAPMFMAMAGEHYLRWASNEDGYVTMLRSTRGVVEEITPELMAVDVERARRMRSTVAVISTKAEAAEARDADGSTPVDVTGKDDLLGEARNRLTPRNYAQVDAERANALSKLTPKQREELLAFGGRLDELIRKKDAAGVLKAMDETKLDLTPLNPYAISTRAEAMAQLGRQAEALSLMDREIARAPHPGLFLSRAGLHYVAKRQTEFQADLLAALEAGPNSLAALNAAVTSSNLRKDPVKLAELRRRIALLQSDEPERWIQLARAEQATGDIEAAAQAYEDAQEAGAIGTTALLPLAELQIELKRYDEASRTYDAVVASRPNLPETLNEACYGRALMNRELPKALTECDRALALKPNMPEALDSRAFVKFRMERFAEAITDYDRVLAKDPKLPESLYGRGLARLRLGQTQLGQADLDAARKLSADVEKTFADYGVTP